MYMAYHSYIHNYTYKQCKQMAWHLWNKGRAVSED